MPGIILPRRDVACNEAAAVATASLQQTDILTVEERGFLATLGLVLDAGSPQSANHMVERWLDAAKHSPRAYRRRACAVLKLAAARD